MRGYFKNLQMSTELGKYPTIFNFNFDTIKNEIDYYFDASNGRLTKSLYAPNGRVEAHWGRFVNLQADRFTITGTNITFDESFIENLTSHNNLSFRFSTDFSTKEQASAIASYREFMNGNAGETGWRTYYTHDDKSVLSTYNSKNDFFKYADGTVLGFTLRDELDLVESEVAKLINNLNVKADTADVSLSDFTSSATANGDTQALGASAPVSQGRDLAYIECLESDIDCYAYSVEVYSAPKNVIRSKVKAPSDYEDIIRKHAFLYVENTNGYVKVSNQKAFAINTLQKGDIVNVILAPHDKTNSDFNIRLNDSEVVNVKKNDSRLVRLKLICLEAGDSMKWDVYEYSGNISILKLK